MTNQTAQNNNQGDDGESWEVLLMPDARDANVNPKSPYIDFQLNTWLGRLSLVVRSRSTIESDVSRSIVKKSRTHLHLQEQSSLFQLPAEIRLIIYELIFEVEAADHGIKLRRPVPHERNRSILAPLATCHRFHDEAESVFWSINRIYIDDVALLKSISKQARDGMTMLTVPAKDGSSLLAMLQDIHQAPNLKSLWIVRPLNVRFINHQEWAVMAHQIILEIKKMAVLKEVKFITPECNDLKDYEAIRKQKLDEIDARICAAALQSVAVGVSKSSSSNGVCEIDRPGQKC
ncbi:uncharacterized protein RCC_01985 [Ramularia collo-cygni]|uniref:F-box domain-containing protein n=1 Tax=Ramularia collo-cygni TaxID=112498 RepID=A0A2D3V0Z8_9PEZI|nr:uncharacterized protein RCC_01985 [Ramularia collo-cygni]CZT16144.1 uncharacterized protein RCC_01985 [Ramularia collo-cygni]